MIHLAQTKRDQQENWKHVTLDLEQSPTKVRNSRSNYRNKHSQKVFKRNEAFIVDGTNSTFAYSLEAVEHKTHTKHVRLETQKEVRLKEITLK